MHPKGPPDQLRDVQERPRSAQETPKKCPRGTKSRPRAAQRHQKPSKIEAGGRPERNFCVFAAWIAQRCVSGGCWVDFRSFFASRARWQTCVSYVAVVFAKEVGCLTLASCPPPQLVRQNRLTNSGLSAPPPGGNVKVANSNFEINFNKI